MGGGLLRGLNQREEADQRGVGWGQVRQMRALGKEEQLRPGRGDQEQSADGQADGKLPQGPCSGMECFRRFSPFGQHLAVPCPKHGSISFLTFWLQALSLMTSTQLPPWPVPKLCPRAQPSLCAAPFLPNPRPRPSPCLSLHGCLVPSTQLGRGHLYNWSFKRRR